MQAAFFLGEKEKILKRVGISINTDLELHESIQLQPK